MVEFIPFETVYEISSCNMAYLGDPNENPMLQKWSTDRSSGSLTWHHHRIWAIIKGSGSANTLFGNIQLNENTVYYLPGTSLISTKCDSYMEQYYIDFIPKTASNIFDNYYLLSHISKETDLILPLIKLIQANYTQKNEIAAFTCNSAINVILSRFLRETSQKYSVAKVLFPAVKHINNHFCDQEIISVKELANMTNYSQQHFERIFKKIYYTSPKKYILSKRIIKAQFLLSGKNASISTVATECGFDDPLYFSRVFAKLTGMSPSVFQASLSKK